MKTKSIQTNYYIIYQHFNINLMNHSIGSNSLSLPIFHDQLTIRSSGIKQLVYLLIQSIFIIDIP